MADSKLWFGVACNVFSLTNITCNKAVSTVEVVISGGKLDVTGRLGCWMTGDLLFLEGCDEEFSSHQRLHVRDWDLEP